MKMKTPRPLALSALLSAIALCLSPTTSQAALFKCINADGHVTFTDGACPTGARERTSLNDKKGNPESDSKRRERTSALKAMSDEAYRRCLDGMVESLRKSNPELPEDTEAKIERPLKQFLSHGNGRFVYQAVVRYRSEGKNKETAIHCNAVKLGEFPWNIQYQELQTRVFIDLPPSTDGTTATDKAKITGESAEGDASSPIAAPSKP